MKKKNDDLKREAKRARMANESLILDLERARSLATDCLKDFAEVSGKKLAHRVSAMSRLAGDTSQRSRHPRGSRV